MSASNTDSLVEVLKEIRDELRAVRAQLGSPAARMTTSGIRTEVVDRAARWRTAALAGGGLAVALLAIVLGVVLRERPAPAIVAVAPPVSATPAAKPATPTAMPPALAPAAQAPVALAAAAAAPATRSPQPLAVKPPAGTKPPPGTPPAARAPAAVPAIASVPVPVKKRVKPDVAGKAPSEVTPDEDEAIAFSPSPRRARAHRMSYGPVESEPAKL